MKLTYKSITDKKVAIKLNGKLVTTKHTDANGAECEIKGVEITSAEAVKLYATFLANGMSENFTNFPVTLDKDAEEMVVVERIIVKTNAGPKAGVKTDLYDPDPVAFCACGEDFTLPVENK